MLLILEKSDDVNANGSNGRTALHEIVCTEFSGFWQENWTALQLLLDYGALTDARDTDGGQHGI
jgi:hypothetical protein